MSRVLPILFNTEMVQAILDGRKTVTRRVIKVPPYYPYFYKLHDNSDGALTGTKNRLFAGFYDEDKIFYIDGEKHIDAVYYQAPYQPGDILYVRETWNFAYDMDDNDHIIEETGRYIYFADGAMPFTHWVDTDTGEHKDKMPWSPSIHMPKEAARIWLKVTDVRVERLKDISDEQAKKEGFSCRNEFIQTFLNMYPECTEESWLWVIEFERCEKPESEG